MLQTQRQLSGLRITSAVAEPAFAGQTVLLRLQLESRPDQRPVRRRGARSWCCSTGRDQPGACRWICSCPRRFADSGARPHCACNQARLSDCSGPGPGCNWMCARWSIRRRMAAFRFREVPGGDNGKSKPGMGLDELAWLRAFREGDSPRQVAWKAYARGAPLLVREYQGSVAAAREFSFDALRDLGVEARLAQLCRWVVDAAAQNESWTLTLPGATVHQRHWRTASTGMPVPAGAVRQSGWRMSASESHGATPGPRCRTGPCSWCWQHSPPAYCCMQTGCPCGVLLPQALRWHGTACSCWGDCACRGLRCAC